MNKTNLDAGLLLGGRILMSAIFLFAGLGKLGGYAATQGYMESMGIPGALLPLVILLELGGGLALLFGFRVRIAAFLLAGFSVLSALVFHFDFADQVQSILFMKNLALAGGLLYVTASGAGAFAVGRAA